MTAERPEEAARREKFFRLLDTLASVPNRGRRRQQAIQTLGLRLDGRQARLLLTLVAVWEESGEAAFQPTLPPRENNGSSCRQRPRDDDGDDAA